MAAEHACSTPRDISNLCACACSAAQDVTSAPTFTTYNTRQKGTATMHSNGKDCEEMQRNKVTCLDMDRYAINRNAGRQGAANISLAFSPLDYILSVVTLRFCLVSPQLQLLPSPTPSRCLFVALSQRAPRLNSKMHWQVRQSLY